MAGQVVTRHLDRPLIGFEKSGDHPHRGGLAGTIGSQKPQNVSPADLKADAVDGLDPAVVFDQPLDVDEDVSRPIRLVLFWQVSLLLETVRSDARTIDRQHRPMAPK